ncbi:MAG: class B sortase, partial [Oliverpabstia sp.]
DREYYLHRDFYGKESYAGVPFIGAGNPQKESDILFLYGHNMRNGTMFADLLNYEREEYQKEHTVVQFDTLWECHKYQVIECLRVKEQDWKNSDSQLYGILQCLYERMENVIVLVTCSYGEIEERFVVIGVREK